MWEATERQRSELQAELHYTRGCVTVLTAEMQQHEADMENRAAHWTIMSIFALQAKNPEMDLSDLPGEYWDELATLA